MPQIESLSSNIIRILSEFGKEKICKVLSPAENDDEDYISIHRELTEQLDNAISAHRKDFSITETRPQSLECDVVRFQNKKDKWVAFVGLLDGYPYEIFTGKLDDEDGIALPKTVTKGCIIKKMDENGQKRYDFQFVNRRGYKTTVEGLSERFNKEYWDYAKLISGVLRYRMPLPHVIRLVNNLQLESEDINNWASGVSKALKRYLNDPETVEEKSNEKEEALDVMPINED